MIYTFSDCVLRYPALHGPAGGGLGEGEGEGLQSALGQWGSLVDTRLQVTRHEVFLGQWTFLAAHGGSSATTSGVFGWSSDDAQVRSSLYPPLPKRAAGPGGEFFNSLSRLPRKRRPHISSRRFPALRGRHGAVRHGTRTARRFPAHRREATACSRRRCRQKVPMVRDCWTTPTVRDDVDFG
jgi:hypothetical protein